MEAEPKYRCFLGEFERPLYWGNLTALLLLHVLAVGYFVYKLATFDPHHDPFLLGYATLLGILGGLGITGGAHRYWTHRCFKATLPAKLLFLVLYSVSGQVSGRAAAAPSSGRLLQNNLRDWVRDHRVHHKFSETDADPHNANRGFWFAHVGWLCMRKHPLVAAKGRTVDVSDITQDPLLAFHVRWVSLALAQRGIALSLFCAGTGRGSSWPSASSSPPSFPRSSSRSPPPRASGWSAWCATPPT